MGTGSALSLLIAVTATAACCITYVVHSGTARVAGSLQLTAGTYFKDSEVIRREAPDYRRTFTYAVMYLVTAWRASFE